MLSRLIANTLLLLAAVALASLAQAQAPTGGSEGNAIWRVHIDSLLSQPEVKYATILAELRKVRYSDSLMTYLRTEAARRNHPAAEAFAAGSLGVIARNRTAYDSALMFHEQALELARTAADTLSQVVALNSRGVVLRRADRVTQALDAHQAALALARQVSDPDYGTLRAIAISHNSTGQIHLTLNQLDLAEAAFKASMEVERRNGNTLGLAINYANLANLYEQRDSLTEALQAYRTALVYNDSLDSDFGRAICWIGMARVLTRQGSFGNALRLARDALPLAEARGDAYYVTNAELAYAGVLTAVGNFDVATEHLDRGRELAAQHNLLDEEARAYRQYAELEEARGNPAAALAHLKRGVELEARVLNDKNQRYVSALSAQYASEMREAEIVRLAQDNELVRERARRNQRNFIVLALALALFAAIVLVFNRQRKLVLQRELVQLEQQRLASQMNPHFLFNALNSVKSYLVSNEGDVAIAYLSRFARLMRRILSSTIDEEVPLSQELENSELYVAVENARFNGAVEYLVDVGEDVDTDFLKVPPLMLQPFLENALWHGLRTKEGRKVIELEVRVGNDEELELIVRDNGVGRTAAASEARHRHRTAKSVGLDITRRRLQHFARRQGRTADFDIHDLVGAEGEALGTEVVVRIA